MANVISGIMQTGGVAYYDSNQPGKNIFSSGIISPYTLLSIPAYWRGVNFLCNNLATFPRSVRLNGAELKTPHKLDRLLERKPNAYQNATVFWHTWFMHLAHSSNAYARIVRQPNLLDVASLHNMDPAFVTPFRFAPDAEKPWDLQQFYHYLPTQEILPASEVLHLSGLSYDGQAGIDQLYAHMDTFQRAKSVDKYLTRYLQKGTVIRGSIEIPEGATDDQIAKIVSTIQTYFYGANAERDVIVLGGGAKLNNSTLSPLQSQMMEQTAYTTKQIGQILGVNPHFMFDDSEGKYNDNVSQAGEEAVRFTFRPIIEQAEDELTTKLLSTVEQEAGYTIHLDPDALLRGDRQTQSTIAIAEKTAGLITGNEGREAIGYSPTTDPEANKLKTSGDTAPAAPKPAALKSAAESIDRDTFAAALQPLLAAACDRVEAKTTKAFENKADKPAADRTIWANVFSAEQERYATEALQPVAEAFAKSGATAAIDVAKIAARYATGIRKRAADGSIKPLSEIYTEVTSGN